MTGLGPVVLAHSFGASPQEIWQLLDDRVKRVEWLPVEIDLVVGGEVSEPVEASPRRTGRVDVVEAGTLLGFRWKTEHDQYETTVVLRLERGSEAATTVSLVETGISSLPNPADRVRHAHDFWQTAIEQLARLLQPTDSTALMLANENLVEGEVIDGEVLTEAEQEPEIEVTVSDEDVLEIEATIEAEEIQEWEVIIEGPPETDPEPSRD